MKHLNQPDWESWLFNNFADVATQGLSPRHERLWEWLEALTPGIQPRARVEVWPRGGAKSSTAELGCVRVGTKLSRRFALYVSGTQDQADLHVQSIASLFEKAGMDRAINKYGSSRGWRRDQLRTANGFNVAAYGLDAAARGVKLDQYRPDLIIFDDVDAANDTLQTIDKKIRAITTSIIPAGSSDCAVLFVQNLIHEESIVSQLVDGRAEFLLDRDVPSIEPAVLNLETEIVEDEEGRKLHRIKDGIATWEGQSLPICEKQINSWGLKAFKREAQHEVQGADGYVFDVSKLEAVEPSEVPPLVAVCLAADLAATEGGGNHTVLFLLGRDAVGRYYILAVIRGQWGSDRVQACIKLSREHYRTMPGFRLKIPQDGGQAGKAQADQMKKAHGDDRPKIESVTGKKWVRAAPFAEQVNLGNVKLVKADLPDFLRAVRDESAGYRPLLEDLSYVRWHQACKDELRKFRENVPDQVDDTVDAGSDAYNELAGKKTIRIF